MTPAPEPLSDNRLHARLWLGIGIILFGLLAAADNLGILPFGFALNLWPLVLVVWGLAKVARRGQERPLSGFILILAGIFLLLANFGRENLVEAIWPLFVVAVGILVVLKTLRRKRGIPPELASQEGFLSVMAILGGCKRRIANLDFKGGELTAIFGGFELDMRQAALQDGQARVDVFILFGGGDIHVPQGWTVTLKATSIAGALEDKTLHLPQEPGQALEPGGRPTLVLTGMALFGGLTVSN
jgi:predicted membrane protein